MIDTIKNVEKIIFNLEQYTKCKMELIALSFKAHISKLIGTLILLFILLFILSFSYLLLCLGFAFSLGKWIDNYLFGFFIIVFINIVIGIIVWKKRNQYIIQPIANFILRQSNIN